MSPHCSHTFQGGIPGLAAWVKAHEHGGLFPAQPGHVDFVRVAEHGPGHLTVGDHLPIGRGRAENPLHPLPLLRLGEKIGGGGVPPGLEDFGQYGRVGAAQFP